MAVFICRHSREISTLMTASTIAIQVLSIILLMTKQNILHFTQYCLNTEKLSVFFKLQTKVHPITIWSMSSYVIIPYTRQLRFSVTVIYSFNLQVAYHYLEVRDRCI